MVHNIFSINVKEYIITELKISYKALDNHIVKLNNLKILLDRYYTSSAPNITWLIKDKQNKIIYHQKRIYYFKRRIKILKLFPKRPQIISKLLTAINTNIAKEILRGGIYTIPFNLGRLYILVVNRKNIYKNINWYQSYQELEKIAKRECIDIYNSYKNKEIDKFIFTRAMQPYTYPTPHKPRWIIYNLSETAWMWYFRKGNFKDRNKHPFSFKPTEKMQQRNMTPADIYKTFDNVEGIIEASNIGNINKLQLIKLINPSFKQYYHDISTD